MIKSKNPIKKTTYNFEAGEIIPINKPVGWTSFDVVNKIRKALRIKKVGHTGTLDPFASGLLIILTGKKTKLAAAFQDLPKIYEGVIELGIQTDTLDVDGKIVKREEIPEFTKKEIEVTLKNFEGESLQTPPAHSAVKIGGKRAYQMARQNQPVQLEPRKIHIYSITLLEFSRNKVYFSVACSKGTYIRALARDFARQLNTVGTLISLKRLQIGDYSIQDAWEIDKFIDWAIHSRKETENNKRRK